MVIETPPIPNDMVDLMKALAKQVIKDKPDNIYEFSAKFFEDLLIKRDGSLDKGYGKFRRYEKYCAYMKTMDKRPKPKSIDTTATSCINYDSTDSGISSGGGDLGGHQGLLPSGGEEGPPIMEVNGVAIKAIPRQTTSKAVRQPKNVSMNSQVANSLLVSDSMDPIDECLTKQLPRASSKMVRKLSSKRNPENLIVIAEETSMDVVDSEELIRQTGAAARIQRAFRRCVIKSREKKEIRAAEIIQKAYKVFVAKKISNFEVDGIKPLANHFVKVTTVEETHQEPNAIAIHDKQSEHSVSNDLQIDNDIISKEEIISDQVVADSNDAKVSHIILKVDELSSTSEKVEIDTKLTCNDEGNHDNELTVNEVAQSNGQTSFLDKEIGSNIETHILKDNIVVLENINNKDNIEPSGQELNNDTKNNIVESGEVETINIADNIVQNEEKDKLITEQVISNKQKTNKEDTNFQIEEVETTNNKDSIVQSGAKDIALKEEVVSKVEIPQTKDIIVDNSDDKDKLETIHTAGSKAEELGNVSLISVINSAPENNYINVFNVDSRKDSKENSPDTLPSHSSLIDETITNKMDTIDLTNRANNEINDSLLNENTIGNVAKPMSVIADGTGHDDSDSTVDASNIIDEIHIIESQSELNLSAKNNDRNVVGKPDEKYFAIDEIEPIKNDIIVQDTILDTGSNNIKTYDADRIQISEEHQSLNIHNQNSDLTNIEKPIVKCEENRSLKNIEKPNDDDLIVQCETSPALQGFEKPDAAMLLEECEEIPSLKEMEQPNDADLTVKCEAKQDIEANPSSSNNTMVENRSLDGDLQENVKTQMDPKLSTPNEEKPSQEQILSNSDEQHEVNSNCTEDKNSNQIDQNLLKTIVLNPLNSPLNLIQNESKVNEFAVESNTTDAPAIQTIPNDSFLELSPRDLENNDEKTEIDIDIKQDLDFKETPNSSGDNDDGNDEVDFPNKDIEFLSEKENPVSETGIMTTHEIPETISLDKDTINQSSLSIALDTQPSLKNSPTILRDLSSLNIPSTTNSPTFEKDNAQDDSTIPGTPVSRLPSPSSVSQSSSAPTPESELLSDITVVDTTDNNPLDVDLNSQTDLESKTSDAEPAETNSTLDNIETNVSNSEDQLNSDKLKQLSATDVQKQTNPDGDSNENVQMQKDSAIENFGKETINKIEIIQPVTAVEVAQSDAFSLNEPSSLSPVKEPTAKITMMSNTNTQISIGDSIIQHDNLEDDESDNNSSEENFPINSNGFPEPKPTVPYEPLLSSDLSETDDVQIRRCAGDSCVDETSRDELDELSEVENVDLTSFGEDSLEAMYYRIRKDEILLDKSRKQMSAGKSDEIKKNSYEDHGISEQPTEVSNQEEETSKENEDLYEKHGISEQLTTETSNQEEENDVDNERSPNPVRFAIEQQKVLVQKLHHSGVNYEDVVTPLEVDEEDDQYPESLDIRRKMWASSVSETDSDYVDLSAHRLVRDDFNISTAVDHLSSSESGSTIVSAATRIQAGARGFLTRRRIRRSSGGTSAASVDKTCSFGNAAIDKSLEDLIEQQELLTMDEAVVKVQRFYRMYRQRKPPTEKQKRLVLAHECDDSQCLDADEDDPNLGESQDLGDIIGVKVEQKKIAQTSLEKCVSVAPHLQFAEKEIVEQRVSDDEQHQSTRNDVVQPAKIAPNDAQRERGDGGGWSPNNQRMSIALSSADGDSFEMDSVHHQRRRLTLQRGDAVQQYSSPDESSSPQNIQTSASAKAALPNTVQTPTTLTPPLALPSTQKKSQRKLLGVRQNSMPVQIDSDLIRIIPKHLRKRIKSAESVSAAAARKESLTRKSHM